MASTRPAWALNLPNGASWEEHWWDFTSEQDIADWAWTVVGGDGAEQCAWKGSISLTDGRLGLLTLTNDDNDNDSIVGILKNECLRFNSLGKTSYLIARLKVSDATQSDFFFGAMKTTTTPDTLISDGVFFKKDDGDDDLDACRAFNAATAPDDYSQEQNVYTVVDDTFMVLVMRIVMDANTAAIGRIDYYVDGVTKASTTASASIVNDEELAPFVFIKNGAAAAKSMTIDSIGVLQER